MEDFEVVYFPVKRITSSNNSVQFSVTYLEDCFQFLVADRLPNVLNVPYHEIFNESVVHSYEHFN